MDPVALARSWTCSVARPAAFRPGG